MTAQRIQHANLSIRGAQAQLQSLQRNPGCVQRQAADWLQHLSQRRPQYTVMRSIRHASWCL